MSEFKPKSKEITTLFRYDTDYSADSVEWCPHNPFHNVFVCANYQLKESENADKPCERLGRVLLFTIDSIDGLKLIQQIDTAAVLDQKWSPNLIGNRVILGVVNAKKTLEIYELNSSPLELKLKTFYRFEDKDDGKDRLILSLDWSNGKYPSEEPEIIVSDSRGQIHLFSFNNKELTLKKTWESHSYEAWIAAFYYWDPNVVLSGGDDCIFVKHDKRIEDDSVIVKNKSHEAGVTSIHSNKEREFIVASGSYDTNVRLWDLRNFKSPLSTIITPGPVWRVKWNPHYYKHLLAACMLGGAHVINCDSSEIIESYYEHENICYGADWAHIPQDKCLKLYQKSTLVGTCSFYDHLLCISGLNL